MNDDKLNTYKPCKDHCNGHSPECKDCEIDCLRGLLREVANSPTGYTSATEDANGVVTVHWQTIEVSGELWAKLLPLRTPPSGEVKP
jgi:hypothetical protein